MGLSRTSFFGLASLLLFTVACGTNNQQNTPSTVVAADVYRGTAQVGSSQYPMRTFILPDNRFFAVYGDPDLGTFVKPTHLVQGQGQFGQSSFLVPQLTDYDSLGDAITGSASGTVSQTNTLSATVKEGGSSYMLLGASESFSFSGAQSTTVTSGNWTGSSLGGSPVPFSTFQVAADGTLSADLSTWDPYQGVFTDRCTVTAHLTPNQQSYFDMTIDINQTTATIPCSRAGQTGSGLAIVSYPQGNAELFLEYTMNNKTGAYLGHR